MDPGTKAFIFLIGGGALLAAGKWLFHKVFGDAPRPDPTASTPENRFDPPGGPDLKDR